MKAQCTYEKRAEYFTPAQGQNPRIWPQSDQSWLSQLGRLTDLGNTADWLASAPLARGVLDAAPGPIPILDDKGGIAACNHTKRRRLLERIFLHDLMNRVAALEVVTAAAVERSAPVHGQRESLDMALVLSRSIKEEIHSHQVLMLAEDDALKTCFVEVDAALILRQEAEVVELLDCAWGKQIILAQLENVELRTDRGLLGCVLFNLLKTALEATRLDSEISCAVSQVGGNAVFSVRNRGRIPNYVMRKLFHAPGSTKDSNRGLGLYSVKLLTEKYLSGRVGLFVEGETIRFEVALPAIPPTAA